MRNKVIYISAILVALTLISACASANNNNKPNAGISKNTLIHDEREREYFQYTPTNINKEEDLPLLLVLHGGGGKARSMIRFTKARFNQLADKHNFYVVYPQGLGKSWNDGRKNLQSYASANNIDDVGFFQALLGKLKAEHNIDKNKIFVTGISNGGFMSFRLGCSLRDEIKAIAPVTASISEDALQFCEGTSNVSLALFNGTDDPLVPYAGGYVKLLGQKRGKITSTEETISHWGKMIGCNEKHSIENLADSKKDGTTVTIFTYDQCSSNAKIVLYRINGGGHTWPGGVQYLGKRLVGITSRDINACDEIWKFFSKQLSH